MKAVFPYIFIVFSEVFAGFCYIFLGFFILGALSTPYHVSGKSPAVAPDWHEIGRQTTRNPQVVTGTVFNNLLMVDPTRAMLATTLSSEQRIN